MAGGGSSLWHGPVLSRIAMQYRPTQFDDSVNVTTSNPLLEFAKFLTIIGGLLFGLYWLSGLAIDRIVDHISIEQEQWLFSHMGLEHVLPEAQKDKETVVAKLQQLLDSLPPQSKPAGYDFTIMLDDDDAINAYAVPGGVIVLTQGLLDAMQSENALVFVLGHELGHFASRDHLRGLGRGLVASFTSLLLLGEDSGISSLIGNTSLAISHSHTRNQERVADMYGLQSLLDHYGHAGGATEFFEAVQAHHGQKEWLGYGSTHPMTDERIETVNERIHFFDADTDETKPPSWK